MLTIALWLTRWQDPRRGGKYPRLRQLAMTVLAIQATSVPAERVFSSASQTDTPERNRLSPQMMERLQTLKFNIKNKVIHLGSAHFTENPEDYAAITFDEITQDDILASIAQ